MAEYTREWKYRAWHPAEQKMYSPEDLEEPDTEEERAENDLRTADRRGSSYCGHQDTAADRTGTDAEYQLV